MTRPLFQPGKRSHRLVFRHVQQVIKRLFVTCACDDFPQNPVDHRFSLIAGMTDHAFQHA
ncbi:hypothetical protein DVJ83_17250 (plasmid) [Deinococcus wulumuqiensis]|uniref:Uncharacterized protein n=1 Tax=Deinococcus wulumuqiensis TaxID=980427 RepID=A0A345IME2_9DEIO|nr:hypothetical protein DVJ83_17250 [Deinococcus wulumuqiensis]